MLLTTWLNSLLQPPRRRRRKTEIIAAQIETLEHRTMLSAAAIEAIVVTDPTALGPSGEVVTLPDSVTFVDEWEAFSVELWVTTPDADQGVSAASIDLRYNTNIVTAVNVLFGPAFDSDQTVNINDQAGLVDNISATAKSNNVGKENFALLARIEFDSRGTDAAPVQPLERNIGPFDLQFGLSDASVELVDAGAVITQTGLPPDTELFAVVYDFNDDGRIDFDDFSVFAGVFRQTVETSTSEFAWLADFDKDGAVNFGDFSLFAGNFRQTRESVADIIFPDTFPDAWRPPDVPPDPSTVAPPLDMSVATTLATATEFLYTGTNPIQTGVQPGTIEPIRAAVLRGEVGDEDGNPLSGVSITILNHPEFGSTRTRADGMFDIAVNGGGPLTVNYTKEGFLTVQRQVDVPWQDYVFAPDVVMIPLDTVVTTIDLSASDPIQVAQGSVVTDADGTRQATLLFQQGTSAEMVMPDGSTQPITTLNVRATEYTIGDSGPNAMPAELPPASAYTYAVEFSADEALAAGATEVRFDQPVFFYVENFLGFPVGGIVPVGFYDRQAGQWIPSDNGLIMQVIDVTAGLAEIDIDGDGVADDATVLAGLGITDAEREQLAALYAPGESLWRVPITHFSPWDYNWPYGPPEDAEASNQPPPKTDDKLDDTCEQGGFSIVECQNQILGERLPITGTPFTFNYRSDRVPGRVAANTLVIPLSGESVPASLKRIELGIEVAGREFSETFPAQPNLTHTFTFDGKDGYGRTLQGAQTATVRIGYVYDVVYRTPSQFAQSFGRFGGALLIGNRARGEFTISQKFVSPIGLWDARGQGLGAWILDVHHGYDPVAQVLYLGDGARRSAESVSAVIRTVADGSMRFPADVAVAPDGSLYIADYDRVHHVSPDGTLTTVAGGGDPPDGLGDGGLATEARIVNTLGVTVGPDGSLYISDHSDSRIRRVSPDGIITTVAGDGQFCEPRTAPCGDGGPATEASLSAPIGGVAVGPDGSLYIPDFGSSSIRRVGPDGIITTVAGTGEFGFGGDGGPATEAILDGPWDVAVGPDGSIYIADAFNNRIRRVGTDGIITTVAGTGGFGFVGDGGPATEAELNFPVSVAVGSDGSLYIVDGNIKVRFVSPDGIISTIAGSLEADASSFFVEGLPATRARIQPEALAVGPDGSVYLAEGGLGRVRQVAPPLPGFSAADFAIPSEDGSELYQFDVAGRHLRTLNTLTGAVLYEFRYDIEGRLSEIEDGDGNLTTIERDGDGNPTAIIAPFGQRTELTLDANGYLASIANPADETTSFGYTSDGLLTAKTDPRGNTYQYQYDELGLLTRTEDPAGGFLQMTCSEFDNGFQVTKTTAEGRTTTYRVERSRTGEQRRITTFPDGTQTESLIGTDGSLTVNYPDGTAVSFLQGPDPRFGMQAPVVEELTVTTPGGLTQVITTDRSVTLADPNDPLSLQTLTTTVTLNDHTYTQIYDATANTLTTTSPKGHESVVTLNDQGRLLGLQAANLDPVQWAYDNRGRVEMIAQGSGDDERLTTINYGSDGKASEITHPRLGTQAFEYDPAGRLVRYVLTDGEAVGLGYDQNGNLASVTPPGQPEHTAAYTPVNLAAEYVPPDAASNTGPTSFSYDLDRRLTSVLLPGGDEIGLDYNSGGRLITLVLPRGAVGYDYDPDTGQLATITAPDSGTLSFEYDAGLLLSSTWAGAVSGSVVNEFTDEFRLASRSVNGGNTINFGYDDDGFLTQAGNLVITRDAATGLLSETTLGGVRDEWSVDSFGDLAAYGAAFSGTDVFATELERNTGGLITKKRESVDGVTTTLEYAYDPNGRLIEVLKDGAPAATYAYDANGNRLSVTTPDGTIMASYDAQDRLLEYGETTYTYTADGRLASRAASGQTTTYTYDAVGNIMEVVLSVGRQIQYVIDGADRRTGKKIDGQLVQGFLYADQLNPVAELDGGGSVVARFVYGTKGHVPDHMIKNATTYRIITDHLGSPRVVIDTSSGAIVQRMDYDAFGNVVLDTNPGFQPFGFAGGLYDADTGLVRFGARDYDPEVGRWTATDPIRFSGGSPNLYQYAGSDPVNSFDPTGLWVVSVGISAQIHVKLGGKLSVSYIFDDDGDWGVEICVGAGVGIGGGTSLKATVDPFGDLQPGLSVTSGVSVSGTAILGFGVTGSIGAGGSLNLNELFSNCQVGTDFWDAWTDSSSLGVSGNVGLGLGLELGVSADATGCVQFVAAG